MKCNKTISIKVIKLLDCFSNKSLNEFVLKVSRFPEITSLPSFDYNIPVHFIGRDKLFSFYYYYLIDNVFHVKLI